MYEPPVNNAKPKLSVLKEESTGEGSDEEDETTDTEDSDDKTECGSEDETERDDEAKFKRTKTLSQRTKSFIE